MAKAILGHTGRPDFRVLSEVRRLRQRVSDLEAELARLRSENHALTAGASHETAHAVAVRGPATTVTPVSRH